MLAHLASRGGCGDGRSGGDIDSAMSVAACADDVQRWVRKMDGDHARTERLDYADDFVGGFALGTEKGEEGGDFGVMGCAAGGVGDGVGGLLGCEILTAD